MCNSVRVYSDLFRCESHTSIQTHKHIRKIHKTLKYIDTSVRKVIGEKNVHKKLIQKQINAYAFIG